MKEITRESFAILAKTVANRRLQRELRFVPERISDWSERELLAVSTRSPNEGVLLVELDDQLYPLVYERGKALLDTATGRAKPITCDFCCTWQRGANAATITFTHRKTGNRVTFLCCTDLQCSLHVRNHTAAATLSRAQLHEDMTTDDRIARLRRRLRAIVEQMTAPTP